MSISAIPAAVRPAAAAEQGAVEGCVAAAFAPFAAAIGKPPAPMLADYRALIAAGVVSVLGEPPSLTGVLVARPIADHLFVDTVAVPPALQRCGNGRRLMAFAEDLARARGLVVVRLYTHVLMTAARAFYPRLGYVETGRRLEDGYDRVYFAKALG